MMDVFVLKLLLTPALIAAASLAGRRWGIGVSGWLVGLPFTSGPVAFFLAVEKGIPFAASAALGTFAGTISQTLAGLVYARLAFRLHWRAALLISSLAFFAVTAAVQPLNPPAVPLFLVVCLTLAAGLGLMPRQPAEASAAVRRLPRWDLPLRMMLTTAVVLLLTGTASLLGPHLTGLLTPFPMYAMTLSVFAHAQQGPAAAVNVWRGLLFGLFAFACFFLVLAESLAPFGITGAFLLAITAALLVQGGTLWVFQRRNLARMKQHPH